LLLIMNMSFTHPLPRTVLTVSKRDVLTLRQGPT
jgi:hypothetical protein